MISKKVLLAIVCVAILASLCLVGFYVAISRAAYLEGKVESLQETVSSLEDERNSLQEDNENLWDTINELNSTLQTVRNSVVFINVTFEENAVIVKVNDNQYNGRDWLAIFINSTLGGGIAVSADNWTISPVALDINGNIRQTTYGVPVIDTDRFSCCFILEEGYTFKVNYCSEVGNATWIFLFRDADSGSRVFKVVSY